jgi:ferrous iron transport protein B
LSYFPGADLETSYLARLGHSLAPVGAVLGLDWRLLVALLASFIAKENAIAALGILYGAGMPGDGWAATLAASVPTASALSFIAATLLFIPCVATCAVMRKELGDGRWMLFAVTLHGVIAVAITALIYHVSSLLIL